jgi:hypothetical protein
MISRAIHRSATSAPYHTASTATACALDLLQDNLVCGVPSAAFDMKNGHPMLDASTGLQRIARRPV